MTKAEARQRAHYKRQLAKWEAGEWTPPAGWAQMVVDRFPDLVEVMRERVLGKEAAEEARKAHVERVTPKVGDVIEIVPQRMLKRPGVTVTLKKQERLIIGVDHVKRKIRYASNTWGWRLFVKLRLAFSRVFRRAM